MGSNPTPGVLPMSVAGACSIDADVIHPYTKTLLSAVPVPDPERRRKPIKLKGEVPSAVRIPSGYRFHPRCPEAFDGCPLEELSSKAISIGHNVACHLYRRKPEMHDALRLKDRASSGPPDRVTLDH